MDNRGSLKLLGKAANGSPKNYFATLISNIWTTALRHEEQSNILGHIGLHGVMRSLNWLWSFILVFSVEESILTCLFQAHKTNWETTWKMVQPWRYTNSFDCATSQLEEYKFVESSIPWSPSILVSLIMLQRSCNSIRTLSLRWIWVSTKSRCHNWTTEFFQIPCNGGYINFK